MTTLIVGFDAAWTEKNSGALVGVLSDKNGIFDEICLPLVVDFRRAESTILEWQERYRPESTIVFLDQPTIVKNAGGQRPVDNLASSPVSLRYGGMQPANTSKKAMFGEDAPVWRFLNLFGGPADLLEPLAGTCVVETYPVLAMIALDWMLPDALSCRPATQI